MSKFLNIIKEKWKLFLLLVLLLGVILYLFIPRNLAALADVRGAEIEKITLCAVFVDNGNRHVKIELTEAQQQTFLDMMKRTYLFRNPIDLRYSHDDDFGYYFEIVRSQTYKDSVPPLVHYFTEDIISVNGIQYRFYGDAFEEYFEDLVD